MNQSKRYVIGLDFGALTARGLLVDVSNGDEIAVSICGYQDAVIEQALPENNVPLPAGFALQNPQDFEYALESILKDIWREAGIQSEQIIGIGVDFTASSMLPLDRKKVPLCYNPRFKKNPHSWVKNWKHHSAHNYAGILRKTALELNESFIHNYGDSISSQGMFPKILETFYEAPEVYRAAYRFVEAGDWIVYLLTGNLCKSNNLAGYKAFWEDDAGYPSNAFFKRIDPQLEDIIDKKIGRNIFRNMSPAGNLCEHMAEITGLSRNTRVAVCNIDAHSSFMGGGITDGSTLMVSAGMCNCMMLVSQQKVQNRMFTGVIKDGILPGYYGYESCQPTVGEMFDWLIGTALTRTYMEEASKHNVDIYSVLNEKIAKMRPGESGLLVLDWWNGNGSYLRNLNLSGTIVGLTLGSTIEDIYRAMVEGTGLGCRKIVEGFEINGISISRICACGAIAFNSPQIMQIYADITGKPISIAQSKQTAALGSAMCGAVAAGVENGGYATIFDAIQNMSKPPQIVYRPNLEYREIYQRMYDEYNRVTGFFENEGKDVMQTLKNIREDAKARKN